MEEYFPENKIKKILLAPKMDLKNYKIAHRHLVICCHDVFIAYQGGIFLVTRDNEPVKDYIWPIGGRVERGMKIQDSLKRKVKEECGLSLTGIKELGVGRTLFNTEPFGHGKGTDTLNIVFFAKASGKIKLDKLHKQPVIIKPESYNKKFAQSLHPYVRKFLEMALKMI